VELLDAPEVTPSGKGETSRDPEEVEDTDENLIIVPPRTFALSGDDLSDPIPEFIPG